MKTLENSSVAVKYVPSDYEKMGISLDNPLTNIGCGKCVYYRHIFSNDDSLQMLENLKSEIDFMSMNHKSGPVPRKITIQGNRKIINGEEFEPIYRHPTDDEMPVLPMTPTVLLIKNKLENILNMELNHVLIQQYRDGADCIKEHADKTLDISIGTPVVNFSLGATRTFYLKAKKDFLEDSACENIIPSQKISLENNSLFILDWETNKAFLHGIKADKRRLCEKRLDELANNGERISLTFRKIDSYRRLRDGVVVGQGGRVSLTDISIPPATTNADQTEDALISNEINSFMSSNEEQSMRLLEGFSAENRCYHFDRDRYYGSGFSIARIHCLTPQSS